MEPIQNILGVGMEIELEVPHGILPVRQKGKLLIHLYALGLEDLEQLALRIGIVALHKREAFAGWPIVLLIMGDSQHTLVGDHLGVLCRGL